MAEAGGGVNQNLWEYELTIDNEQLTIIVSLRDGLKFRISEGNALAVNANQQLKYPKVHGYSGNFETFEPRRGGYQPPGGYRK